MADLAGRLLMYRLLVGLPRQSLRASRRVERAWAVGGGADELLKGVRLKTRRLVEANGMETIFAAGMSVCGTRLVRNAVAVPGKMVRFLIGNKLPSGRNLWEHPLLSQAQILETLHKRTLHVLALGG